MPGAQIPSGLLSPLQMAVAVYPPEPQPNAAHFKPTQLIIAARQLG